MCGCRPGCGRLGRRPFHAESQDLLGVAQATHTTPLVRQRGPLHRAILERPRRTTTVSWSEIEIDRLAYGLPPTASVTRDSREPSGEWRRLLQRILRSLLNSQSHSRSLTRMSVSARPAIVEQFAPGGARRGSLRVHPWQAIAHPSGLHKSDPCPPGDQTR
jgi:hypothetical protein